MGRTRKLSEIVLELGLATTAYGIPNLLRSKRVYQKHLWIFFFFVSATCSYFLIYETIVNYLDFKVVTLVESVYESPVEFPAVSICSYSGDHFKGKSLSEFVERCSFGYDKSCESNPDNFFEKFIGNNGYECYRFNSGKNLTNHSIPIISSTIGGVDDSFTIGIDKNKDMQIWIHDRNFNHRFINFNNHFEDRVFVSANSYTEVIIHKVVEVKLEEPFNKCLNDVTQFKYNKTIIDFIIRINEIYTQERCFEWCFELDYIEKRPCDCTSIELGEVWKRCFIDSKKSKCIWEYKSVFYSKHLVEKCTKYCPLECISVSYDIRSNSISNYNHTRIKVYYGNLKYTSIKQEAKTQLIEVISDIGGTFGLLIGFSFVTFFEIIELLIEILLNSLSTSYLKNEKKDFIIRI